MRILNIIIFSFLLGIGIQAQEVKVLSFKSTPMDLSASTHPRYDINNDVGALVKVLLAEPNVKFEGDIIGTPEFKANEYWVYVTAGTKFLKIKAPNAIPLQVSFADNKLSPAQSKMTYELVLSRSGQTLTSQQKQKFTIMFTPSNANVLIDNNMYPSENGKATGMLSVGKHEFIVASLGYESSEGTFTLKESSPYSVEIHLSKSAATALESSVLQSNGNNVNNNSPIAPRSSDMTYSANSQYILDKVAEGNKLYDEKKYKDAYNCFLIAAEAGNAMAQYLLGECYYNGQGITQNYVEAVKWYRKAAEQGHGAAQLQLGMCYDYGRGVIIDHAEAFKWYEKATKQDFEQVKEMERLETVQGNINSRSMLRLKVINKKGNVRGAFISHKRNGKNVNIAISDIDGCARLYNFQVGDVLMVSYLGNRTQEIRFNILPAEYTVVMKDGSGTDKSIFR